MLTVAKRLRISVHVDHEVIDSVLVDGVGFPNELDMVQGDVILELVSFFSVPYFALHPTFM
jgi:hypothetical protein